MMLTASPVVRVAPASAALRAPRRASAASRSRATVCAAKPVESMTLKDGRKVNVYASTADATAAVADAFVAAYNEARSSAARVSTQQLRGACGYRRNRAGCIAASALLMPRR